MVSNTPSPSHSPRSANTSYLHHPPPDEQLHYYRPPPQQHQPQHTSLPAPFGSPHSFPFSHASAPPFHELGPYTPPGPSASTAAGAQAQANGHPYYMPPMSHHPAQHPDPTVPAPADQIHISNLTTVTDSTSPTQQKYQAEDARHSLSAKDPYQLSEQFYQNVRTVEVHTVDDGMKKDDKSFCFFLFGVLLGAVSGPIAYCTLSCQYRFGFVRKRRICFVWGVFSGLCTTVVLAFALWYTRYKGRES